MAKVLCPITRSDIWQTYKEGRINTFVFIFFYIFIDVWNKHNPHYVEVPDPEPDVIDKVFALKEDEIKAIFPDTWTHQSNLNPLSLLFKFKLIGLDWRTTDEAASMLVQMERRKLILRNGDLIKRNPGRVYPRSELYSHSEGCVSVHRQS